MTENFMLNTVQAMGHYTFLLISFFVYVWHSSTHVGLCYTGCPKKVVHFSTHHIFRTDQDKHTHTHLTALFSGTTWVSRCQKGKTNLDFTEARDSEWQWHQLGCMQVSTSLQTDNHPSNRPLSFLQAGCPSCRPTNSVKALKAR